MTISNWLHKTISDFKVASLSTAQLDAELLLSTTLGKERSWLHAHSESLIDSDVLLLLQEKVARRLQHEPIAYIIGIQEFYGRNFYVTPDTLTPRPETETMVEFACEQAKGLGVEKIQVLDIGTGSGCIIISVEQELTSLETKEQVSEISFLGLDISDKALKVAHKNAERLGSRVKFKEFDLMNDSLHALLIPNATLLIAANLPYVPDDFHINLAASHEPEFAIFGGIDGLDYYRKMFDQISKAKVENKKESVIVFTESLPTQHKALRGIAKSSGFEQTSVRDFTQLFVKQSPS